MIHKIYVMLGSKCNMDCRYCMQHTLVKTPLPPQKASGKFYDFIEKAHKQNSKLGICFFGGEPLVYYKTIHEIVEKLPNLKYSIITNGKAITDEMVAFFNEHNISVTVSWDGYNVKETRRYNVFSVPSLKHRILRINSLALTAVCSAYCYPVDILDSFESIDRIYCPIHDRHIGINIDTIFDAGLMDKSLIDIDYGRVRREIRYICDKFVSSAPYAYTRFIEQELRRAGKYKGYCYCGNGYTVINLDLDGNLYECHNVSNPIGTVDGNIFEYFKNVLECDATRERIQSRCKDCIALPLCKGGCKLMRNLDDYCKLKRAFYGTIVEYCLERETNAK